MLKSIWVKTSLFLIWLFSFNCTGYHYFNPYVTNTNPAPEYATGAIFTKGGGLFYREIVVGQIGNAKVEKTAESCSYSLLWLLSFGDSSINTARKKANITKIALVEYEVLAFVGFFYHGFCVKVSGE